MLHAKRNEEMSQVNMFKNKSYYMNFMHKNMSYNLSFFRKKFHEIS